MKTSHYISLLAILCAILVSGCAAKGPLYSDVKSSLKPEKGKGLALVYFSGGFMGKAAKWHIYANNQLLTDRFQRGSFYSYQAAPGDLLLSTTHNMTWAPVGLLEQGLGTIRKDQPTVRIEPNQTYFITMGFGAWREKLTQVSPEAAAEDIADCHWLNAPGQ